MNRPHLAPALCAAIALAVAAGNVFFATTASGEPANTKIASRATDATPLAPLSKRFADAQTGESPDFQKHVIPLLGRLGCNGRSCHGSFQGRGGFQLSLFGYDFDGDHKALLDENSGRVDPDDVDESLILAKPVDADLHEGGKRFAEGSWQHHVLRNWVAGGAKFDRRSQTLLKLDVTPVEVLFTTEGESVELSAVAHWDDGSVEDVTELCRFNSNDDAIAAIDENGRVDSGQPGDTHVVVFYDNAVVAVPVLRPIASSLGREKKIQFSQPIDRLVQQKLDKLGIIPSGTCTDAEFIRRASLDITGVLPSGDRVRQYLSDQSPDKRERLIDELLDSPGYAAWWATRFSDWTGNNEVQLTNVLPFRGAASRMWHEWLRVRLDANTPYDQLVEGIVTAQSRQPGESYVDYCKSMSEACQPGNEAIFAERDGMPLFWARRNFAKPEERAIGFAYTFLGVRIECAQCHKHPFDQWSKDDFKQFSQLFTPIRVSQNLVANDAKKVREELLQKLTGGKKLRGGDLRRAISKAAKDGQTVPFGELTITTRKISPKQKKQRELAKKKGRKVPPSPQGKILGHEESISLDKDPRGELMEWLRSPENPYFAKAIVNRIWSNYFGTGIVDPTDDMNLANPPSNAALLDHLASEFIARDFDLRWLHRTIVSSETYQRCVETNETNAFDRVNFSHHIPRRLPAEVVYDAIDLATGSDSLASKLRDDVDQMAIAEGKPRARNQQNFALVVFGQSIRESNCDCDRSDEPSLLQSIYLRNDKEMHERLADKNGWVAQACESLGVKGPKSTSVDPRRRAIERKADGVRRQLISRIRRFNDTPKPRRAKTRPAVKKEYDRTVARMQQIGFKMPPLAQLLKNPGSWKELESAAPRSENLSSKTINTIVEDAYLRTLSRYPSEDESRTTIAFIAESDTPADGIGSLLWALVNTKEFIITH